VTGLEMKLKVIKGPGKWKINDGYCSPVRHVPIYHSYDLEEQKQSDRTS
jgi:hypothetical protein